MQRTNLNDIVAFISVANERSFTRSAAKLGLSQSTLSHLIRKLEERLGVRLLTRTTRSVAPTAAGARLLQSIGPKLEEVDAELASLSDVGKKPAGTIRISSTDYATDMILWPRLLPLLQRHPQIKVELITDYGLTDIVAQRFDAGVRAGEQVARDMVAVRLGPDISMAVVGSPDYFKDRKLPKTPQDLTQHNCINLRLPTQGGLYAWEFAKGTRELRVRVEGQLTVNGSPQMLVAALDGFGLAYLPEDIVQPYVAHRRLTRVLQEWCPKEVGYHFYYPSRRQNSAAFSLVVDALRYRP